MRILRHVLPVLAPVAMWCAIGARETNAQALTTVGVIDGVVSDTNLVSLPEATASILGSNVHVTTGANGRFRIRGLHHGAYILVIHRLGYKPVSTSVAIDGADTLRMSFPLQPIVTALDTVSVVGERMTARMSEFDARRRAGIGHFITAEQIQARNVVFFADILQGQLSVQILTAKDGTQRAVTTRGLTDFEPSNVCPFQLILDDVIMPRATVLESMPAPNQIAGVEIYSGAATIPLRYKGTVASACGLILVWTKEGRP